MSFTGKDQHKRPYCRWTILLVLLAVCLCMVALVATRFLADKAALMNFSGSWLCIDKNLGEESFAPPFQRQLLNGLDAVRASISDEASGLPCAVINKNKRSSTHNYIIINSNTSSNARKNSSNKNGR